jgi:Predicted phosphoesterase
METSGPIIKFAVISDIHGNIHALDAVMNDLSHRNVDKVINLGDSVYGPLFPDITANRLMELDIINIMGNQDRMLLAKSDNIVLSTHKYVIDSMSADHLTWIAGFRNNMIMNEDVFLCHGSPASDEVYLLEEVTEKGAEMRNPESTIIQLAGLKQSMIICGHSHVPRTVYLPNGQIIVNAGSVGLQAYSDELPFFHKMETCSPNAKYAIISCEPGGWRAEHIEVEYEWEKAFAQAARNNRMDWARAIKTGRA